MPKDLSKDDRQNILQAQADAKKLLQDPELFNKRFEELFAKYDKNKDGIIGFEEYQQFITEMLISMGRTKVQSKLIFTYFERADNDNSGIIEKEEFNEEMQRNFDVDVDDADLNDEIDELDYQMRMEMDGQGMQVPGEMNGPQPSNLNAEEAALEAELK